MKKLILAICLVMGFASAVYAASFCCGDGKTKEECCAERGKIYCPSDETCRTRCPDVTPPDCIGGCINPEGECCTWCPSAEVCQRMGKCHKIVDGCYDCVTCPVPNPCPVPQCLNQDGECCDSCPRTCPAGQCLVSVDGCYECGECGDDDDDTETTEPNLCEGKDEYKDCKKCDEKTGEYTIGGCQDPKPECCNNVCYEKCPEGKVRNPDTCACECEDPPACNKMGTMLDEEQCICICDPAEVRNDCPGEQVWLGYPECTCGCPPE